MITQRIALAALALSSMLAAGCGGGSGNPNPQNQLPTAAISADVTNGAAPLTVNFSAAASTDADGVIAGYAWDLDGNGSFETATGAVATTQRVYPAAGSFMVRVRVTDNAGGAATAAVTITVTGGGGGGGFDGTFDVPPAEVFVDQSDPGDTPDIFWRKNFYHVLPLAFDADRVYQNESLKDWADEILRLTNIERANNGGLPPLVRDNHLEMVMQAHCRDIALRDYPALSHETLEGLTIRNRLEAINPPAWNAIAENVAKQQLSPQQVVNGWMGSAGHRQNILSANFERIGIGVYYDSRPGKGYFVFGQYFARFDPGANPDAHNWIEINEAP